MGRGAQNLFVVLHQHAVVNHSHESRSKQLLSFKTRRFKNNVVSLPFPRPARRVDQRRILAVNRRRLAIGIREIFKRIQHLHLILAHQHDAAVAPVLARALHHRRCRPFHMQLHVPELLTRVHAPRARHHFHVAVYDFPRHRARRPVAHRGQFRGILAVE